ncbi:hypothetical protein [Palleronia pelagia]|uniref:Uncharacterized protein n=1 Tax=Palleronia pelagia TaxID=387096 RepID=A0A1H8HXD9_9RHOB|nr:hypothetical protein [Palleronia pelagia]SEN60576.1 hypothetical protein SAMN04488011_10529 [Palleronia pelagia]
MTEIQKIQARAVQRLGCFAIEGLILLNALMAIVGNLGDGVNLWFICGLIAAAVALAISWAIGMFLIADPDAAIAETRAVITLQGVMPIVSLVLFCAGCLFL